MTKYRLKTSVMDQGAWKSNGEEFHVTHISITIETPMNCDRVAADRVAVREALSQVDGQLSGYTEEDHEFTKIRSQYFMNTATGTVARYEDWWYMKQNERVNAVDLGEVVQVEWNTPTGWEEV